MRPRLPLVAAALAATAMAAAQTPREADSRLMAYRWKAGQAVRYRLTADLSGSLPIMDSTEPIDLEATLEIVYRVVPRQVSPSAGTTLDFRIEKAEAELAKIPLPVPFEDAQKVLDRTVTMAPTGAVKEIKQAPPLPFAVTIPGLDPQRLFTLICPVVFPATPVKPGDTWEFDGELMGSEDTPARFTATVLPPDGPTADAAEAPLRVRLEFAMDVDQKLDADKKPLTDGEGVRRTRTGTISGAGVMAFSPRQGRLLRGHLTIQANIVERVLGEPEPDQPAEVASQVKAVVRVAPVTAPAKTQPTKRNKP